MQNMSYEKTQKIVHLLYIPFSGLGLHNGFRGNTWLKERIKVFKQFVIPSLQAQSNKNFVLWCSWRREEKNNHIVKELISWLDELPEFRVIHTFSGVCFYDDKYPTEIAKSRLVDSIHLSMPSLLDELAGVKYVLMTIQPSDDVYHIQAVDQIQKIFQQTDYQAVGFKHGYICNYLTKEVAEYNPLTNPPFYTIKFERDTFVDPLAHANYTALKMDIDQYKKGTPLPSHEYVGNCLKYGQINYRGFLVGTHGQNISTTFTNPYKGESVDNSILKEFGVDDAEPLKIKIGLFKRFMLKMPYKVQRKVRYILNEWKWYKLKTYKGLIK